MIDREAIWAALFTRLTTELGAALKSSTRRMIDWDMVEQTDQPALVLIAIGDRLEHDDPELPPKHHLKAMVLLYTRDDAGADPATTPETLLMSLVSSVETALKLQPGDSGGLAYNALVAPSTTLGGLVQHTWVSDLQFHQGAGSGQTGATVLIDMLAVDDH